MAAAAPRVAKCAAFGGQVVRSQSHLLVGAIRAVLLNSHRLGAIGQQHLRQAGGRAKRWLQVRSDHPGKHVQNTRTAGVPPACAAAHLSHLLCHAARHVQQAALEGANFAAMCRRGARRGDQKRDKRDHSMQCRRTVCHLAHQTSSISPRHASAAFAGCCAHGESLPLLLLPARHPAGPCGIRPSGSSCVTGAPCVHTPLRCAEQSSGAWRLLLSGREPQGTQGAQHPQHRPPG